MINRNTMFRLIDGNIENNITMIVMLFAIYCMKKNTRKTTNFLEL